MESNSSFKTTRIDVRLHPAEKEQLMHLAKQSKMTMSEYMRLLLHDRCNQQR